jgi:hypothetical protein
MLLIKCFIIKIVITFKLKPCTVLALSAKLHFKVFKNSGSGALAPCKYAMVFPVVQDFLCEYQSQHYQVLGWYEDEEVREIS